MQHPHLHPNPGDSRTRGDDAERVHAALAQITELLQQVLSAVGASPAFTTQPDPSPVWLTAKQTADRFGISVKALYSDVARGGRFAMAASKVGGRLRFNRSGLDRLPLQMRFRRRDLGSRVPSPGGTERW